MTEILGAILTGGASSRMGENKASVEIACRPMSAWVSEALAAAVSDSSHMVVLGDTPIGGIRSIDDRQGTGPLRGLAAVADATEHLDAVPRAVLLIAVDHPWVRPETLRALISRFDDRAVVPVHHGVRQVTCAIYPMSLVTAAAEGATAAQGFQALLDNVDVDEVAPETWTGWGEDGRSWFSVDTPEDVGAGLSRYGPPGEANEDRR